MHPEGMVQLTPDTAVLMGSLGVCLIFVEFNRPGRVLPGAGGLLLALLAAAFLLRLGMAPWACFLLLACASVLFANLWRNVPSVALLAATCAAIVSLHGLLRRGSGHSISLPVASLCGAGLGLGSAALTRVAYRARRAKALD